MLHAAAERAGLGGVTLVPEPVAAANVFLTLGGPDAPQARPGSVFVVYDLGAGTFDASVVRHGGGAFEVLSAEGLSTSGGLDIDAAIVGYLGAVHGGQNPQAWQRLTHPGTSAERRSHRLLWDDVRSAKEMLSRTSSTMIHIPALESDVPLGRDQFEQLARPILTATVTATRAAIASAGLGVGDVQGVFLVGGGSRIPLVATLLHQAIGKAPTVVEQPELVVAQGAVGGSTQFTAVAPAPVTPPPAAGVARAAVSVPPAPPAPPVSVPPAPSAPPVSAPPGATTYGPVSGPPGMPMSGVPVSGGSMPSSPVSPGFTAAPVSGGSMPSTPVSPGFAAGPGRGYPMSPAPAYPQPQPAGGKPRRTGLLVGAFVAVLLVLGGGVYGVTQLMKDSSSGNNSGSGQGESPVAAAVDRADVDWTTTAKDYEGRAGLTISYQCPTSDIIGTVWGSSPYTTDSSVCTAAVHDGRISLEDGGRVVIKIVQGQDSYEGTLQHGINTTSYGAYDWAFQIIS
ncbi:Hsp70 family protein [Dactylosporangium sp. CA-233914]|uniref:Hsp70 family protein n=1 Tax=Dactylosporangium sp. CA-233914 TaxID=3239934 RepID=UPI003D8D14D6